MDSLPAASGDEHTRDEHQHRRYDRWVTYYSCVQTLDEFLIERPPSKTYKPDWEWLTVSKETKFQSLDLSGAGIVKASEDLCIERRGDVDVRHIQNLAKQHGILSGKWLLYVSAAEVDAAWGKIARGVVNGSLGKDAKVSTAEEPEPWVVKGVHVKNRKPEGSGAKKQPTVDGKPVRGMHVICIYTSNFQDFFQAKAVREKLRAMGFEKRMGYKPCAYTLCGIYSGNVGVFWLPFTIPSAQECFVDTVCFFHDTEEGMADEVAMSNRFLELCLQILLVLICFMHSILEQFPQARVLEAVREAAPSSAELPSAEVEGVGTTQAPVLQTCQPPTASFTDWRAAGLATAPAKSPTPSPSEVTSPGFTFQSSLSSQDGASMSTTPPPRALVPTPLLVSPWRRYTECSNSMFVSPVLVQVSIRSGMTISIW